MSWFSIWPVVACWVVLVGAAEFCAWLRNRRRAQAAARHALATRQALDAARGQSAVAEPPAARTLILGQRYTVMARNRVRTGTLKSVFVVDCGTHLCFEDETPLGKQVFLVCEQQLQATARPIVRGHLAGFELVTTAN